MPADDPYKAGCWSPAERRAWKWPDPLTPSQWAERYRTLSRRQSSRSGAWRNSIAPYLVGLMDIAFRHRCVRKLNVMKAAQIGVSEALRNVIGYLASEEPDPALLNLPDEKSGKAIFGERILPLFDDTKRLQSLQTSSSRDMTLYSVLLSNGFTLRLAWSGSATSLASHPIRCVFNDETDKMQEWVGRESDPVSLAEVRTATYDNSLIVNVSTPTTRNGIIFQLWDSSPVKLAYFVPCPYCGKPQTFKFDRLRYEKFHDLKTREERAGAVEMKKAAWYECEQCSGKILDSHKPRMVNAGCWATEDLRYKLFCDGREEGEFPQASEIGIRLSALYSLAAKHTFPLIAAEWIKSDGDLRKTQNFRNSWLGEVFEVQVQQTQSHELASRLATAPPPLIVPEWAAALIVTADTQKDHFYWLIRAWGYGFRSQLIHLGVCRTFDELYQAAFSAKFQVIGASNLVQPTAMLIDSGGNRTNEVYEFALRDRGRIFPIKGSSWVMKRPWNMTTLSNGVVLRTLDTGFYKDMLARLIQDADKTLWQVHNQVTEDYCLQMSSEHKILDRKTNRQSWVTKTTGAANHWWDIETYQCAAADMANVGIMAPVAAPMTPPAPTRQPDIPDRPAWMPEPPSGWTNR